MKNRTYKIIIAGGGTGGHLFPAIAIGENLISNGVTVKYVGSRYGIESTYKFIDKESIELLDLRGIQRTLSPSSILKNILLPYRIIKSFFQVSSLFRKYKPDFVIGTGGYSCAIPLFIAFRKKILTAIQEQNVIPGLVTTKFSNKVDFIFTSFDETEGYLSNYKNLLCTGNPVRNIIKNTSKVDASNTFNLSSDKFTILIIGGSQGAESINKHFLRNLNHYIEKDIQIIWQVGSKSKNIINQVNNSNIKVYEFINDMGAAYSASDLVISRAGATAISEIISLGKPSILIPYPYAANNHQVANALALQSHKAALMVEEGNLKEGKLEKFISDSSEFKIEMKDMALNAIKFSKKKSAALIATKIINEVSSVR